MSLLRFSQLLCPDMITQGKGSVIVTGNTSAHRGKAEFGGTASTKAAQKILSESMARFLRPHKGIHVAYINYLWGSIFKLLLTQLLMFHLDKRNVA